jgi:Mg2+/Co2+ transporter CorC
VGRIIRNVEDARQNLLDVLKDVRDNKPIDPETLKAAQEAIKRIIK